ncbi:MAG: methyltransferase domain-containing protein [Sedimentisphaerales bacterium]|nr:methyltransferase domain-containing protein [Sedimentisphaerales bacterium]
MERFAFGENWQNFSKQLTYERYLGAKQSLQGLVGDLTGKSFLDVGCGSGLFSIAASALGAKKVVAFDVDPQCVSTAKNLLKNIRQWDPQTREDVMQFSVDSIINEKLALGPFDVVYSWGVLHHTGNMYKAFEAVTRLVAKGGLLAIAIYNKHFTSPVWKMIKFTYVKSPAIVRKILVWLVLIVKIPAVLIISRRNPFTKERGMSYYTDIVDWVGGYPYEYASPAEVTRFFEQRGFKLKRLVKTKGFTGCNEFVFERIA